MIKCEVIEDFMFARFGELKNIVRKHKEQNGRLFVGDTFECDEEIAKYLSGNNAKNKVVVKVIEVKPIKKIEKKQVEKIENTIEYKEEKPQKKTAKKVSKKK